MKLSEDQENAKKVFIDFLVDNNQFMVLQGAAGSGKTTLIKQLITAVQKQQEMQKLLYKDSESFLMNIVLTATTKPAASILTELVDFPASTIHSALGLKLRNDYETGETILYENKYSEGTTIFNSIIFIDEASMINKQLFGFIRSKTNRCKIVLIGDQYQLAPVKEQSTIMEVLNCPKAELSQVMRHTSSIATVGAIFKEVVKTGKFDPIKLDGIDVQKLDKEAFKGEIHKVFSDPNYTPKKARILAWSNACVLKYNAYVRQSKGLPVHTQIGETVILNNNLLEKKKIRINANSLVKITGIGSSYENVIGDISGRLINLDTAKVSAFCPNDHRQTQIVLKSLAKEKKWKEYFFVKEQWLDLRFPYASTIHKAQGGTYEKVFIDLMDIARCNRKTDIARLLYVAITRAVKQVFLYGNLSI